MPGARRPSSQAGQEPDRPRPEHDHEVAGHDPGPLVHVVDHVGRRLDHGGRVEIQAVGNAVQQLLRHDAQPGHRAVDSPAGAAFVGADLHVARAAEITLAAVPRVRLAHHALADAEVLAVRPQFDNRARILVPQDHRWPVGKPIVFDVDVGAADAAGVDLDQHLAGSGPRLGHVHQAEIADTFGGLDQGFHGNPSIRTDVGAAVVLPPPVTPNSGMAVQLPPQPQSPFPICTIVRQNR